MRRFPDWQVRGFMRLHRRLHRAGSRDGRVAIMLGRAWVDSYGLGCAWLVSASCGSGSVGAGGDYRGMGRDHGSSEVRRDHGGRGEDDTRLDIR